MRRMAVVTSCLLVVMMIATCSLADPGVIQDGSSAEAAAAAAAAASAGSSSGGPTPPPPPIVAPPPVIPPVIPGLGAGFNKHVDFSAGAGAGLGSLFGLIPGLGGLTAPVDPELPPPPIESPGGYLGLPYFLGPQYIPATWFGSALAAKGDLLFPIAIFLFAVVGVLFVIKFLLALLVPFLAKKWAIAEALSHKARRSTTTADDLPMDVTKAHHAHLEELSHSVLPSVHDHQKRFHNGDEDGDSDDDFDG